MTREKVYAAIDSERYHQDRKWGTISQHPHEVGAWLLLMQQHVDDAIKAWATHAGDREALEEIRKVLALGVACCEQHGIQTRSKWLEPAVESVR